MKNIVANKEANQYQTFNEALIDLKNDRIDGLLIDRVYANYYLEAEGVLNDYNVFTVGLETEAFAVGARKEDTTLVKKINEAFFLVFTRTASSKKSAKMVWRRCSNQRSKRRTVR